MTAQDLVVIIFSVIFAQVAIYAAVAFYQHWLTYEELKERLFALENTQEVPVKKQASVHSPLKASWDGFRDFRVQRKIFEDKNREVCSFYLSPLDGKPLPSFNPGQYLTFQFHITFPGMSSSQAIMRCYSLSDSPRPETYRITVKKIPAPPSHPDAPSGISSTYLHEQVHEGTVLSVKAPAGHFCLEDHLKGPLVLIAGGIGITPLLSILNTCLHVDPQREVWFYYGLRNGLEHLMKEHLETLAKNHKNLHLHVCYSQPNAEDIQGVDYQHVGHVDITLLRLTLFLKLYQFYVCGPKSMMESLVPALRDWGVSEDCIHYEAFGPASLARPQTDQQTTISTPKIVTFSTSGGKSFPWEDSYTCLLDFAEAKGIPIDYGCRVGHCGSCQTRLEAGEIQYHHPPEVDLPSGTCLLCISVPKTHITLSA